MSSCSSLSSQQIKCKRPKRQPRSIQQKIQSLTSSPVLRIPIPVDLTLLCVPWESLTLSLFALIESRKNEAKKLCTCSSFCISTAIDSLHLGATLITSKQVFAQTNSLELWAEWTKSIPELTPFKVSILLLGTIVKVNGENC